MRVRVGRVRNRKFLTETDGAKPEFPSIPKEAQRDTKGE